MGLLILPLLFAAMYFMTIRPQQQRLRNQRALVASLQAGDEVVTIGGVIGRITVVGEQEVRLDVGNGMELRMARGAIQSRLAPDEPPGEIGP
jgi:preprotein translocase subunit YajC